MNIIRRRLAGHLGRLGLCLGLTLGLALPGVAHAGAIEQLHAFIGNTRTLKADFSQLVVNRSGRKPQQSSGTVLISRPGKLRWEILKPYPQIMVGDGEKFWLYDPELRQVTVRKAGQAIGGTPAALLAGSNEIERNFTLSEAGENDGLLWVEARPKNTDSGFERLRLGFAGGEMRGMELYDQFGQVTHIRLSHIERNTALPPASFRFVPPAGVDVVGE